MTRMYHLESGLAQRQFATSTWAKPNGLGAVIPSDTRGSEGR